MKRDHSVVIRAFSFCLLAMLWPVGNAAAQSERTQQSGVAALRAEIDALKRLLPDQAHAMVDVDYHFSNLWFAARNENWALSEFYLNETRSHLNWAVRLRPVRRLSSGQELDLRAVLQGVEAAGLAEIRTAVDKRDLKDFEAAYRRMTSLCHGCHVAAEKPYLRTRVPEAPSTRMIDLQPGPVR